MQEPLCYELMLTPQLLSQHDERVRQCVILERCTKLVEAGKLGALITRRMPFALAAEGNRMIEAGSMTGKIVLTLD